MSGAPKVAVLGGGIRGVTLAWLVAKAGHDVQLWTRNARKAERLRKKRNTEATAAIELPERVEIATDLAAALRSPMLILAVQPGHVRELLRTAAPDLRAEHRVVHVVKGFERSGARLSEVVEQETRVVQTGALAGPWVPSELWAGEDTAAVVGSRYQGVIDEVTGLLSSEQVRVYGTRDIVGVEVGGAMRTPLAIASGLLLGAGKGRSLHAVLLTRGIAEGVRLTEALGGQRPTLSGLSGIGDWMLTTEDPKDPLVKAAGAMLKGGAFAVEEGATRVRTMLTLAARLGVDMPITESVGAILDGQPLSEVLAELMSRAARPEAE